MVSVTLWATLLAVGLDFAEAGKKQDKDKLGSPNNPFIMQAVFYTNIGSDGFDIFKDIARGDARRDPMTLAFPSIPAIVTAGGIAMESGWEYEVSCDNKKRDDATMSFRRKKHSVNMYRSGSDTVRIGIRADGSVFDDLNHPKDRQAAAVLRLKGGQTMNRLNRYTVFAGEMTGVAWHCGSVAIEVKIGSGKSPESADYKPCLLESDGTKKIECSSVLKPSPPSRPLELGAATVEKSGEECQAKLPFLFSRAENLQDGQSLRLNDVEEVVDDAADARFPKIPMKTPVGEVPISRRTSSPFRISLAAVSDPYIIPVKIYSDLTPEFATESSTKPGRNGGFTVEPGWEYHITCSTKTEFDGVPAARRTKHFVDMYKPRSDTVRIIVDKNTELFDDRRLAKDKGSKKSRAALAVLRLKAGTVVPNEAVGAETDVLGITWRCGSTAYYIKLQTRQMSLNPAGAQLQPVIKTISTGAHRACRMKVEVPKLPLFRKQPLPATIPSPSLDTAVNNLCVATLPFLFAGSPPGLGSDEKMVMHSASRRGSGGTRGMPFEL